MLDDYITLDELGDYMNVNEMWLSSSTLAIDAAQQAVRKYLDQDITFVEEDIEAYDGTGRGVLRLKQRPVRGIIELSVDGTELLDADWYLRGNIIQLLDGGFFPYGRGNILVTYDHGWDATDPGSDGPYEYSPVPADIKLVTLSIAKRRYLAQDSTDETKVSETIGQYSYTRSNAAADMPKDVSFSEAAVLDRYVVRGTPRP